MRSENLTARHPMQFTHPLALILLPLLLFYTVLLGRRSLADLNPWRARVATGLRVAVVLALGLALAGAQWVRHNRHVSVIYAVDVSDSIPAAAKERARAFIHQANQRMKADDQAGIVVFASEAYVEQAPAAKPEPLPAFASAPARDFTDIASGLRLALAALPDGTQKRIVLFSDGNENVGDALEEARLAQASQVPVDVVPCTRTAEVEVVVERLVMPSELKLGEPFEAKVIVHSEAATPARLTLVRTCNTQSDVAAQSIELTPGKNVFTFPQSIDQEGFHTYDAVLEPRLDTTLENNHARSFCFVRGRPKVLYVEGAAGQEQYLARALAAEDVQADVVPPSGLPTQLAEFQNYDALILSDVSAIKLSTAQMKMIQSNVRDLGIGLVMIGGQDSFGPGGYFKTPIEEALPVTMDVRKQRYFPNVGIAIVVDKSGSMGVVENGVQKIYLANEGAIAVVQLLHDDDEITVIPTDSVAKPIFGERMVKAANKGQIIDDIATIRSGGGGIYVRAGLEKAYALLRPSETKLKHIILLADGNDSEQQEGCRELVQQMRPERITLTVVSIGDGTDVPFLKDLTRLGGGRFYLTDRASNLPQIFTKEAVLASKSQLIEKPFTPYLAAESEILRGVTTGGLPPLLGYVATSPKSMANVPLVSSEREPDPILAAWPYGLGRSIAFTSDCKARWGAHWIGWRHYHQFWGQVVRWTMRRSTPGQLETRIVHDRGKAKVVVDALDEKGEFRNFLAMQATVVDPTWESHTLSLCQTGPGRYEGEFDVRAVGTYLVNVGVGEGRGKRGRKGKEGREGGEEKGNWETGKLGNWETGKLGNQPQPSEPNFLISQLPSATLGTSAQTTGLSLSYSPEFRDVRSNEKLLERLAATTNGAILDDPGQVFARREHPARTPQDLWPTLLSLALLLFLGDIAVRRLMLEPAQVREWVGAVAAVLPRLRQRPAARTEEATTSRLLRVKEGVEATTRGGNWETRKPGNSETGKLGNPDAVSRSPSSPIPQFPNFPVSSQADDDEGGSTFARLKRAKQRAHDTERRDSE